MLSYKFYYRILWLKIISKNIYNIKNNNKNSWKIYIRNIHNGKNNDSFILNIYAWI